MLEFLLCLCIRTNEIDNEWMKLPLGPSHLFLHMTLQALHLVHRLVVQNPGFPRAIISIQPPSYLKLPSDTAKVCICGSIKQTFIYSYLETDNKNSGVLQHDKGTKNQSEH